MIRNLNSFNYLTAGFVANLYLIITMSPGLFPPGVFEDSGAMSIVNMLSILIAWAICFFQFVDKKEERLQWFCWIYVVQIYLLREADFHRAFTDEHVTKLAFYSVDTIPWEHKAVAGVITATFLACLFYLLFRKSVTYFHALMRREAWAVALALWFFFLLGSQILDKSALNENANWKIRSIEEILEITAGFYAVMAGALFWCRHLDLRTQVVNKT